MPEMDGLEATKVIRQAEQFTGKHQPIVAMTAHAMAGDRELCLEVGMDEYVSKPIRVNELMDKLALVLGDRKRVASEDQPTKEARPTMDSLSIDWPLVLGEMMGDQALLRDCIEACLQETPQCMNAVRKAIADRDSNALNRAAHSLKGSIAFLHVDVATQSAQKVEEAGHGGDLELAQQEAPKLDKHVECLLDELNAYLTR